MTKKGLPKLPHGQGSFSQYRDKIRYQKNIKINNKTFRLIVYGNTVNECLSLMAKKEKQESKRIVREDKHSLQDRTVVLSDAMHDWLSQYLGSVKNNTYDRMECIINNQIDGYEIGRERVIDISSKDIENHLNIISNYSYSTIKKTYEIIKRFMSFYFANDISSNPMNYVKKPKPTKAVGAITIEQASQNGRLEDLVLTDDEIIIFGKHCLKEPQNGVQGGSKYNPALYFILLTFLRIGEATTLVWGDIDYKKKILNVNKSTTRIVNRDSEIESKTVNIITVPKTKSSIRQVALTDEAFKVLDVIRLRSKFVSKKDFIICTSKGTQVSEQHLLSALKGTLKSCGLNQYGERDKFGLHYLRHTGISYYLRHGVPIDVISEMAGHSSISITSDVYYHVVNEQRTKAAEMMNAIAQKE